MNAKCLDITFPDVPLEQKAQAWLGLNSGKVCFPLSCSSIGSDSLQVYHSVIRGDTIILRRACAKMEIANRIFLPYSFSNYSNGVVVCCFDVEKLKDYFENED